MSIFKDYGDLTAEPSETVHYCAKRARKRDDLSRLNQYYSRELGKSKEERRDTIKKFSLVPRLSIPSAPVPVHIKTAYPLLSSSIERDFSRRNRPIKKTETEVEKAERIRALCSFVDVISKGLLLPSGLNIESGRHSLRIVAKELANRYRVECGHIAEDSPAEIVQAVWARVSLLLLSDFASFPNIVARLNISGIDRIVKPDASLREKSTLLESVATPEKWGRLFRSLMYKNDEKTRRRLGECRSGFNPIRSSINAYRKAEDRRRNEDYLKNAFIYSAGSGSLLPLSDVVGEHHMYKKFSELVVICKGSIKYAKAQGLFGVFTTVTLPSEYHAFNKVKGVGGKPDTSYRNKKFTGKDPKEGSDYYRAKNKLVRARINKAGIKMSYLSVCEPHHDGTPHWHIIAFFQTHADRCIYKKIMSDIFPLEPVGKHRFFNPCEIKDLDYNQNPVGYLLKYLTKTLGGNDGRLSETAQACQDWASIWGICTFSRGGFFSRQSLWRDCRRLHPEECRGLAEHKKIITLMVKHSKNGKYDRLLELVESLDSDILDSVKASIASILDAREKWYLCPDIGRHGIGMGGGEKEEAIINFLAHGIALIQDRQRDEALAVEEAIRSYAFGCSACAFAPLVKPP